MRSCGRVSSKRFWTDDKLDADEVLPSLPSLEALTDFDTDSVIGSAILEGTIVPTDNVCENAEVNC